MISLNTRHKAGTVLTLAVVGFALLADAAAKTVLGLAALGAAVTWAIGSIPIRPRGPRREPASGSGSKASATVLIVLLSLALLNSNAALTKSPRGDMASLLGTLFGILLVVTGLILSIRWRVRLAGYERTCGKQAWAFFLIGFCAWGLLLVVFGIVYFASHPETAWLIVIPFLMGIAYLAGLYACIRWVGRLRGGEKTQRVEPAATGTANVR